MTEFNIYNFFESSDIAEHCQKIGHVFSPLDMAILVNISSKSIKEKHAAYKTIINDYPDTPIHKTLHYDAMDSLHGILRELITWEESKINDFYTTGKDILYRQHIRFIESYNTFEHHMYRYDNCYSSAEKALSAVRESYDFKEDRVYKIGLVKEYIDTDEQFYVWVDFNGEITSISPPTSSDNPPIDFNLIFFHLPVPFEKGDLVTMEYDGKPRILVDIPHWYTGNRPYEEFLSGKFGDGSDMLGRYYYIGENGTLENDHGITDLHMIRYFTGELKGQERFLKYLSQYIKNKDESIDWLINLFCKFKAEADFKELDNLFGGWYRSLEDEDAVRDDS